MTPGKLGFCCIVLNQQGKTPPRYKYSTATVAYVSKLNRREQMEYLRTRVEANCRALYATVNWLRKRPAALRMFRITSGFFPLYTHALGAHAYADPVWRQDIANAMAAIGRLAREHDIRLSLHPGQHCVLNSRDPATRKRSVAEFEYHTRIAEMLGYRGRDHDDFCINVHGGKSFALSEGGVHSWDSSWRALSASARRLITLENDEFCWNTQQIYALCSHLNVRPVLDVHHHWVASGRWPNPHSPAINKLRGFWGERTPKIHLSLALPQALYSALPDAPASARVHQPCLPVPDQPKTVLRVHSDYIWHRKVVQYAGEWLGAGFDIQTEAKAKNQASFALYKELRRDATASLSRTT